MTSPANPPDPPVRTSETAPTTTGARRELPLGWIFLIGLALIFSIIDPVTVELQPNLPLTIAWFVLGTASLAGGWFKRSTLVTWTGAAVLWALVLACLGTQSAPLGLAAGTVWGPRGLLLLVSFVAWVIMLQPPRRLVYGLFAAAVPATVVLAALWYTAPVIPPNAIVYWLAVDSHGTVYANDQDGGMIWVFDSNGTVQGELWPRRGSAGAKGPGIEPPGVSAEPSSASTDVTTAVTPGAIEERNFLYCGIAVDPQDYLYVVDVFKSQMRRFGPGGQFAGSWSLPVPYSATQGCVAADSRSVYLADNRGFVTVYDHQGNLKTTWDVRKQPVGLSVGQEGHVAILYERAVEIRQAQDGKVVRQWDLPPPQGNLGVPYQAILAMHDGDVLVTDLANKQVLRYGPDGKQMSALGSPGREPGQFVNVGGLAEDRQGMVYISDDQNRVIQRFSPDGQVTAVWWAPEPEGGGEE